MNCHAGRHLTSQALAGSLTILVLAACGPRPLAPPPTQPANAPETPAGPVLGLNVDPSSTTLIEGLAWAHGAPVRLPVRWGKLETEPGRIDWAALDAAIRPLADSGHPVLAALTGTPAWARDSTEPPGGLWLCDDPSVTGAAASESAPPKRYADLAAFASRVAARYGDDLYGVEVWPEPNLLPNWSATGPDPESYGQMLAEVADRVHAAAPTTKVVSGGLAQTTDVGVCYLSDLVFLDRLARTGALAKVDAVGIEPFGLRSAPVESPDRSLLNFRRAELAHQVLAERDLADLPLWAVAWGWNAGQDPVTSPWGSHPPEVAANWTAQALGLATTWPWMHAAFLWHLGPDVPRSASVLADPGQGGDEAAGFALVSPSGSWTRLGDEVSALFTGTRLPPPSLPSRQVPAPVLALLMLALAVLVTSLVVLAARSPLSGLASAVAHRCRLSNTHAVVAAVSIGLLWVVLARMPVAGDWFGLALGLALVLVLAGRPELAPAACVLVAPFHASIAIPLGPVRVGVLEAVIGCAFAGWAIAWIGAARAIRTTLVDWLALVLVVWGALAVTWSQFGWEALREWRVVLLEPTLVFLMLRAAVSRPKTSEYALDGLVAGAAVAGLWGLAALGWVLLGHETAGVVRAEGVMRTAGPYGSPNNLALFAGRAVSVAAATALFATGKRRRAIHAVLTVLLLVVVGATFSRGALFIGLPTALLVLVAIAVTTRGADLRRLGRAAVLSAAAALAFVAAFARTDRIAGAFNPTVGGTLHLRLRLWESALRMAMDHPVLGVGPDNFLGHYRDTYVQRDAVQERFLSHPHNLVLDAWTRLGLVGLGVVSLIAVRSAVAGVRGLALAGASRALGAAALVALAYSGAHGLIDNFLFVPDLAVAWWVVVAAALAAEESTSAPPEADSPSTAATR